MPGMNMDIQQLDQFPESIIKLKTPSMMPMELSIVPELKNVV